MQYNKNSAGALGVPGTTSTFNAVISLRTKEEVEQLVSAISRIVQNSVTLFDDLKTDTQCWRPLLQDIITIQTLAQSFVDLCLDPEGKQRTQALVDSMDHSKLNLIELFRNLRAFPSAEQQKSIVVETQNILINMASVTDEMEEDQIFRILRASKLAFQHVMNLKETNSDYRLEVKQEDVRFAVNNLILNLRNRLNVLPEAPIKDDLLFAEDSINRYLEPFIGANRDFLKKFSSDAGQLQGEYLHHLALAIKTIIDVIPHTRTKGSCSFQHELIFQNLDKLADAVQHGSSADAVAGARFLVDEVNKLKQRAAEDPAVDNSALNDSCDRLKEMTQRLLEATKNALADKDNADASRSLNDTLSDVKQHVAQVAAVEASASGNSLRIQLLKAAKDMSADMSSFVSMISADVS